LLVFGQSPLHIVGDNGVYIVYSLYPSLSISLSPSWLIVNSTLKDFNALGWWQTFCAPQNILLIDFVATLTPYRPSTWLYLVAAVWISKSLLPDRENWGVLSSIYVSGVWDWEGPEADKHFRSAGRLWSRAAVGT